MKITLIIPIYNEAGNIASFLTALSFQNKLPNEVIFIDGGSSDGTVEILERFKREQKEINDLDVVVISDRKFSKREAISPIAKARNFGVKLAKNDKILCTDSGCMLSPDWVMEMSTLLISADLVIGRYSYIRRGVLSYLLARSFIPSSKNFANSNFLPSSRSIGFTKNLFFEVGGYPEIAFAAEDTLFASNARKAARKIAVAQKSSVFWELPSSFHELYNKVYTYGWSDAVSSVTIIRYNLKTILFVLFPLMFVYYLVLWRPLSPLILGIQLSGYWSAKMRGKS